MGLPEGLIPCLLSTVSSDFSDSTSVSNAESQLALPLVSTTFLASSLISCPKGSAVCTLAAGGGFCAAAGVEGEGEALGAGEALAAGVGLAAGTGLALAAGAGLAAGVGLAVGAGDGLAATSGDAVGEGACASTSPAENATAADANPARARRNIRKFIRYSPKPAALPAKHCCLTCLLAFRPLTDESSSLRHHSGWPAPHLSPYKAGRNWIF